MPLLKNWLAKQVQQLKGSGTDTLVEKHEQFKCTEDGDHLPNLGVDR